MGSNEKGRWRRVKELDDVMRKNIDAGSEVHSGFEESVYASVIERFMRTMSPSA